MTNATTATEPNRNADYMGSPEWKAIRRARYDETRQEAFRSGSRTLDQIALIRRRLVNMAGHFHGHILNAAGFPEGAYLEDDGLQASAIYNKLQDSLTALDEAERTLKLAWEIM